jgi:tetratricopeptide (TPR) repeat protein
MKRTKYLNWFVYLTILLTVFSLTVEVSAQKKKDLEKAQKIARQGAQLFNKKDYRGAIAKYTEAILVVPNFSEAFYWRGYAHYYLNEYDKAISDFNQAESQGYSKPQEIYRLRWSLNYQAKNYDAALSDVQKALRTDPNNVQLNMAVGDIYRMKENCRDAVPYYQRVSQLDTNNSDVNYFLAQCHASLGEINEQQTTALEALRRKTKYVGESYYLLADAFYRQKKFTEAMDFYEKSLDLRIENYSTFNALADIYRSRNEFEKAVAITRRGLDVFPKDANLYTSLAWFYSLSDRPKEAIIAAQSAVNLAPDQYMGYTNLCRAYNDAQDYQKAIAACNNALRLKPGDGESFYYMGRAYEFLKQNDKAADAYRKAVEGLIKFTQDNPDYSDGYYLLGGAHFALGNDDQAIAAYQRCLELAPRFARARYSLGLAYLIGKKDKVRARQQYTELRQIDNNLAEKLRAAIESAK